MRAAAQIKIRKGPSTALTHGMESVETHPSLRAVLLPLPVAVRLDVDLPTGARSSVPTSRVLLVSPRADGRGVKALQSVLIPN